MAYRASGDDCALLADPAPRSRFLSQGQNILPLRDAGRDLLSQVKRIVLKCEEERKMEHFGLCGGAERAAFITIATVDHTLIPYKNNWLKVPPVEKPKPTPGVWKRLRDYAKPPVTQWEKPPRREGQFAPGDFLLTVGGGCVVGFRLVECAVLINALVCGGGGDLVIEILPGEALETTSLQYIVQLGKYAGPRSLEYKLRVEIRINLERAIVPCTTRPRRPEDAKYGDYYFVEKEFFEECIQQRSMIDYGEFNGYYYGYERPYGPLDPSKAKLTVAKLNEYLTCKIRSRSDSFNEALGYRLTEAQRDQAKAGSAHLTDN